MNQKNYRHYKHKEYIIKEAQNVLFLFKTILAWATILLIWKDNNSKIYVIYTNVTHNIEKISVKT